jgi:FMN phosphatase YigB (HAD superfamily)
MLARQIHDGFVARRGPMIRVSSFDIFDTCLTRTFAHPLDLFHELGARARTRGLTTLAAAEFARRRAGAENAARKASSSHEVTLDEIYRRLESDLGPDAAEQVREMELRLEDESLQAVPEMARRIAAARSAGRQIVFLSDMYLPAIFLQGILAARGMFAPEDRIYLSGERRMSKGSGELFQHVRQNLAGPVTDWVHVGDSLHSDVKVPARFSISAEHFTEAQLNPYERRLCARPVRDEIWKSRLAAAMRLARLARPAEATAREKVIWETGANIAGPLFYGYVRWLLAEARRRGLSRLYFVARDGQVLVKIAELAPSFGAAPVECRYLYGSRRAWLPAAADAAVESGRERLLAYLRKEGFFEREEAAMVDLGWHGRLKQALARVCAGAPDPRRSRVTGFYFALVGDVSGQSDGFCGYVNSLCPEALGSFLFTQQLLEAFAAADHGQTVDYAEGRPVLTRADNPAVTAWGLEALRGGMLAFCRAFGALDDGSAPAAAYLRETLRLLKLFYEEPTFEEATIWGAFPFSDQSVEGELAPLVPDWSWRRTFFGLFRKEDRARLWWPTGMAKARGMPFLRPYYRLQQLWRRWTQGGPT